MSNGNTLDNRVQNSACEFESIFDDANDDPTNTLNGNTLTDFRPSSDGSEEQDVEMEETTIYVSDAEGRPPELDELNQALEDGWEIKDISLGVRKSDQNYCFVVSLEREAPQSIFEVVQA